MPFNPADVDDECQWFAMCTNAADSLMPHPIIGPVPICDRCRTKVDAMRADQTPPSTGLAP